MKSEIIKIKQGFLRALKLAEKKNNVFCVVQNLIIWELELTKEFKHV